MGFQGIFRFFLIFKCYLITWMIGYKPKSLLQSEMGKIQVSPTGIATPSSLCLHSTHPRLRLSQILANLISPRQRDSSDSETRCGGERGRRAQGGAHSLRLHKCSLCDLCASRPLSGLQLPPAYSNWAPGWDAVCAPGLVYPAWTQTRTDEWGRALPPGPARLSSGSLRAGSHPLSEPRGLQGRTRGLPRPGKTLPPRPGSSALHPSRLQGKARPPHPSAAPRILSIRTTRGRLIGRRPLCRAAPQPIAVMGAELRAQPDAPSSCGRTRLWPELPLPLGGAP